MMLRMNGERQYDYILVRDGAILVRVFRTPCETGESVQLEFFDVRTGVPLREIHPRFQEAELERGTLLPDELVATILSEGVRLGVEASVDISKVISILDVKQRRLDSVVADSVLDQLRLISDLLHEFLSVADTADKDERFWMSQQVLALVRKFSGRELEELREIVQWLRSRRKK
jgi:hypothetical protein